MECVEYQLGGLEQRVRDECIKEFNDEMKRTKESADGWKAEVERVKRGHDMMLETIATLRKEKQQLVDRLADSKREVSDMRAQLHADQAVVQGRALKMVSE